MQAADSEKKKKDNDGEGMKWPSMHAKFKEKHGLEDADFKQKQLTWLRSQLKPLNLRNRELDAALSVFAALRKQNGQVTRL